MLRWQLTLGLALGCVVNPADGFPVGATVERDGHRLFCDDPGYCDPEVLERHVAFFDAVAEAGAFEEPVAPVDVYVAEAAQTARHCRASTQCHIPAFRQLFVRQAFHPHEAMHAAMNDGPQPPTMLVEGIATWIECWVGPQDPPTFRPPDQSWPDMWRQGRGEVTYAHAAHFIEFVARRFGPRAPFDLYEACRGERSERCVEATLGADLATLEAAYREERPALPSRGGARCASFVGAAAPLLEGATRTLLMTVEDARGDPLTDPFEAMLRIPLDVGWTAFRVTLEGACEAGGGQLRGRRLVADAGFLSPSLDFGPGVVVIGSEVSDTLLLHALTRGTCSLEVTRVPIEELVDGDTSVSGELALTPDAGSVVTVVPSGSCAPLTVGGPEGFGHAHGRTGEAVADCDGREVAELPWLRTGALHCDRFALPRDCDVEDGSWFITPMAP
ncbi:MAG: hypothetical protein AAGH15_01690 [Myxococcota bacterium]